MKRMIRILSLVSLSSLYVMAGACVMSGDGWSFFNTLNLTNLPILGSIFVRQ